MSRRLHTTFCALLLGAQVALAAEAPPAAKPGTLEVAPARVAPVELDRSIERVLERREYAWRLPRKKSPEDEKGLIESWFARLRKGLGALWRKLEKWFKSDNEPRRNNDGSFSMPFARSTMWILLGIAVVAVLWLILRSWWRPKAQALTATAAEAIPDLHSEHVTADLLPEDEWLQLARDLLAKGDLRLALRAFYLACLAHLGQRELLAIARHKSNLDYRRELQRRASQRREMLGAFEENVLSFERAWYGRAPVTTEVVDRFSTNFEVIRAGSGGRA